MDLFDLEDISLKRLRGITLEDLNLKFDDSSEDLSDTFKNAQELVELLLRTLSKVKHEFYTFQSLNTPFIFYFFKTEDRKRLPQVRRVIKKSLM